MSRRAFLAASGGMAGSAWLALHTPAVAAAAEAALKARQEAEPFRNLSPSLAAGLEAIVARIIPSDDTPGAREAGVIYFIDQALGGFLAEESGTLQAGMDALDAAALEHAGRPFCELGPEAQDELLRGIEQSGFFGLAHYLTIAGMFALPEHGGNRDHLGWALLGFDHRHVWAPPFGHYDAAYHPEPEQHADEGDGHGHG
jgi:gluconate 2-dehydrogenase gamma chain